MTTIFRLLCEQAGMELDTDATLAVERMFERLSANRGDDFGNGKLARTQFEKAIELQAERLAGDVEAFYAIPHRSGHTSGD